MNLLNGYKIADKENIKVNKIDKNVDTTKEVSVNLDVDTRELFYPTVNVNVIKSIDGGKKKILKKGKIKVKSEELKNNTRKLRKDLKRDIGVRKRSIKKYILKSKKNSTESLLKKNKNASKIRTRSTKNRLLKKRRSKRMSKKRVNSRVERVKNKSKKVIRRKSKKRIVKRGGSKLTWSGAIGEARRNLNIVGFEPIRKGSELYNEAKKIYENSKIDK